MRRRREDEKSIQSNEPKATNLQKEVGSSRVGLDQPVLGSVGPTVP